jgi:uncharacterized ferritin-like protein (DUF455 family)
MNLCALPRLGISVEEVGSRLGVFRGALARTTRLMAAWASDTPELEVKIMLGDHVYRDAVAVSALDDRLASLGLRASDGAAEEYVRLSCALARTTDTLARLHGMYRVLKPRLGASLKAYLEATHPVADGPSVRALRAIVDDVDAEIEQGCALFDFVRVTFHPGVSDADVERCWEEAVAAADGESELHLPPSAMRRDSRFRFGPEAHSMREPTNVPSSMHRMLMSIEIPTIEVCGRNIADFPGMPWEFVLDMARQSWDESRHATLCYGRLTQLGARIGDFPINDNLWRLSHGLPLVMRLAVHQRLGEWVGVDGASDGSARLEEVGDLVTARAMQYVVADEVAHVRGGNKWIRRLVGEEGVAKVHDAAVQHRDDVGQSIRGFTRLPLNRDLCLRCGFTEQEVEALAALRAESSASVCERQP